LNHSIVVQAACQAVVCGMMCLEAACKLLAYGTHLMVLCIVLIVSHWISWA